MSDEMNVELITPRGVAVESVAASVIVPGDKGEFGALPGHTKFLSVLKPGEVRFASGGVEKRFAIGRGFVEVEAEKVTILTDTAETAASLDADVIKRAIQVDESRLAESDSDEAEAVVLKDRLERNRARLEVALNE